MKRLDLQYDDISQIVVLILRRKNFWTNSFRLKIFIVAVVNEF